MPSLPEETWPRPAQLGDQSLFPGLEARAYLAYAAAAPLSAPVRDSVIRVLDAYGARGIAAFFEFLPERERLRARLAQLIGAASDDIALTTGTTRGIADLAFCIPWRTGDRVVLFDREFPANVCPWQRAAEMLNLTIDFVSMDGALESEAAILEPLTKLLQHGARLVAMSAVQFQTGLRMPLGAISALCERYGAELCVDAIQACGVVPLRVSETPIDYLVCGAHKWMLGPEGVGFMYIKPARARVLLPRSAGWLGYDDSTRFLFSGPGELRYDRAPKRGPQMFEGSSSSTLGFAALDAAIEPLLSLTPDVIFEHVQRYHDALEPGVQARGLRSLRASAPERRSGILSFQPPKSLSAGDIVAGLRTRGVFASMPDGLLRFAPHFPNRLSEIETVLAALDETLRELRE